MLNLLDESLERFLRAVVPLPTREVDIAFEAPDGDWAAGVARPTVNLYLWDVRPSMTERNLGMLEVTDENGRKQRRAPLPRVECRFLVTAWTSEVNDEHALLGRVLLALLNNPVIGVEYLTNGLAGVEPLPVIELRTGPATENSDFWSALGGQLKPGLDVAVTVTLDAAVVKEAGPPVRELDLRKLALGGTIDEQTTIADEQHTTEEEGAPVAADVDGPIELAARMAGERSD
jgi:hypothetical protein